MERIKGVVSKGMGEGAYFMSMPHYKKELSKALGFESYPGTLNVKTGQEWKNVLALKKEIVVEGFEKDGKKFGGVSCYLAGILDISGAIIMPHFNKHKGNIVEFISKDHVKTKMDIKDGDEVEIWLK
jgi:riboflavin kinase, archaea type